MDKFFSLKNCSRCGVALSARIMSRFNTDVLCMDCSDVEKNHSRYKEAAEAELAEIRAGNYNFPGLLAGKKYPF